MAFVKGGFLKNKILPRPFPVTSVDPSDKLNRGKDVNEPQEINPKKKRLNLVQSLLANKNSGY